MTRRRIAARERLEIFARAGGVCHLCGGKIQPGQDWDVSHDTPLELGGEDGGDNLLPAHRACHRRHTATEDIPRIRKAQRQQMRHVGAKPPSRTPLPFGRGSRLKRKMDGTVVLRHPPTKGPQT